MKKRPSSRAVYHHAPHVAWRRVEEEAVLLNVDTSEYYSLDPVGAQIWERLGKGDPVAKIARAISREYGMAEARVAKDAEGFIKDLLKEKLLQRGES